MKSFGATVFVVLSFTSISIAWGFDGQRKGYVIGGGLGIAPISRWEAPPRETGGNEITIKSADTQPGIAVALNGGYAWDNFNLFVLETSLSTFKSSEFFGNRLVAQGFFGGSWYHYFGPAGSSFFTVAGFGYYFFEIDDIRLFYPDIGTLFGVGYEFKRHWQLGVHVSTGTTFLDPTAKSWRHWNVSVLLGAVAY